MTLHLHLHITTVPCPHLTQKLTSFVLINFHVPSYVIHHPIEFYHSFFHLPYITHQLLERPKQRQTMKTVKFRIKQNESLSVKELLTQELVQEEALREIQIIRARDRQLQTCR